MPDLEPPSPAEIEAMEQSCEPPSEGDEDLPPPPGTYHLPASLPGDSPYKGQPITALPLAEVRKIIQQAGPLARQGRAPWKELVEAAQGELARRTAAQRAAIEARSPVVNGAAPERAQRPSASVGELTSWTFNGGSRLVLVSPMPLPSDAIAELAEIDAVVRKHLKERLA